MIDPNTSKIRKDVEDIQGSGFDTAKDSLVYTGLKKVQRGELTISGTTGNATIPIAVDMDKAFVNCSFCYDCSGAYDAPLIVSYLESVFVKWKITTTTNIHFQRYSNTGPVYIAWEVIEWK